MGESGTGKSTLVRAIAGLWPWGEGEVVMQRDSKLLMLPQKAYVPLGSLRRATTYPMAADSVKDEDVRDALEAVGLGHLLDRLDEEGPWEQTLSGGEKQRLAFARLILHKPNLIVLDEATSALDPGEPGTADEAPQRADSRGDRDQRRPPAGARSLPRAQARAQARRPAARA